MSPVSNTAGDHNTEQGGVSSSAEHEHAFPATQQPWK